MASNYIIAMKQNTLVFSLVLLFLFSCKTKQEILDTNDLDSALPENSLDANTARIGFYNVENLFDTKKDPIKNDVDFTPTGKQKWDDTRYQKKLNDLSKVIRAMGAPSLLGLCEVENKFVVEALTETALLDPYDYEVVHRESPDFRGIDVALMYREDAFKVLSVEAIPINFPKEIVENYTTRDVLYIKGKLKKNKAIVHVFVNHWPSRRGGLEKSEPKRTFVAIQVRKKVDVILKSDADANILLMGDFNDETDNKSIQESLGAIATNPTAKQGQLYNMMAELDAQKLGSYNYRGNLNMLDQIIVSGDMLMSDNEVQVKNPQIFKRDWFIFKHDKYGETPNRTFGGPNYYGGFSDHFPVLIDLYLK